MQVEASLPADGQALEVMQERESLLDDVAELAEVLDVRRTLAGDHRQDATSAQLAPVGVAVVALVTQKCVRSSAWTARLPGDGRNAVDQGEGLGDVVDIGSSGDDLERGALPVADQVVFTARLPAVDRGRAGGLAPFFARMWEASTQARVQSRASAACRWPTSTACWLRWP